MELLGHHRKCLIDLKQIDVIKRHPGTGKYFAGCRDRGVQHQCRVVAHIGAGNHAGPGLKPMSLHVVLAAPEDRRSAIHHARRVAGVMYVLNVEVGELLENQLAECLRVVAMSVVGYCQEARQERSQGLHRCPRTGELFAI